MASAGSTAFHVVPPRVTLKNLFLTTMNPTQIQLIRETFELVAPRSKVAALVFYQRLFDLDPSLRALFREDIEEQARKLMQMLAAAVRLLDKPDSLLPVLQDLGRRHVHYGVRDDHYD